MSSRIRRAARVALPVVAGVAVALAGGLAGPEIAGAQQDRQQVDRELAYLCSPSASSVTVRVTGSFPSSATVGRPIVPADLTLALTTSPTAFAELPGAVAVTSVMRLDTTVTQDADTAAATWTAVQDTPLPVSDSVVLGGAVEPAPVTVNAPGEVAFAAGNLVATVTGYTADGAATEPPSVELTCVLDVAAAPELAVVSVTESTTPSRERLPDDGVAGIEVGPDAQPRVPNLLAGPVPPECHRIAAAPVEYTNSYCAYLTGFSNVAKLNASVLQPAGLQNIGATKFIFVCPEGPGILCQKALVQPELDGKPQLPPAPGSFLAFGFVPTTGTIQLTQIGLGEVYLWSKSTGQPPYPGLATVQVKLSAQVLDAKVNGVPVDIGDNCRTATPIDAVFTANYADYSITKGGVLTGTITIPPFSGCGATEDLDPVFTGLISGPGNYVKLTQGAVCTVTGNNLGCPPVKPEPKR